MIFDVIADCVPTPAMYGARHRLAAILSALHESGHRIRRLTVHSSENATAMTRWAIDHGVQYRWREREWRRPICSGRDVERAAASLDAEDLANGDSAAALLVFNEDLYRVCLAAGLAQGDYAGVWVDAGDLKSAIVDEGRDRVYWQSFEAELAGSRVVISTSTATDAELLGGVLLRNPLPPVSAVTMAGRPNGVPRVLFVGLLEHGPNAEALARFCEIMQRPLTSGDIELNVVGTPSVAAEISRGLARELGRPLDLTAAYMEADVAVAPLVRGTGTSLKVVEALGHGVPVAASAVGARGLPKPVPGLVIVDTWEESEWWGAIKPLRLVSDSTRVDMHRYAVAHFGSSRTVESVMEIVRSMDLPLL